MPPSTSPGEHIFDVRVQEDFVEKLAAARPAQALAELIWNSLDAEATKVTVETDLGLLGQTAIRVSDDGHGIPFEEAKSLFTNIGGSWKRSTATSRNDVRMLHGKEGKGRFRALALGRVVEWDVIAPNKEGENIQYKITLIKDSARRVRITDPTAAPPGSEVGVEVTISELAKDWNLSASNLIQELCEIYALYLVDYADVEIVVAGTRLDPTPLIQLQKSFELPPIISESKTLDVLLEVIEWKRPTERMLYLCNANKFPLHRVTPSIQAPGFEFSAYLRSEYVSELHEAGMLDLAEMDPRLSAAVEEGREQLRRHFKARAIEETTGLVEQWKKDKVYPYPEEPTSNVQVVERQVFDIVAVNIASSLPELQSSDSKSRKFQLRMLRQAIERGRLSYS